MLPCHSCHIYGAQRNKEMGGRSFKVIIWEVKKERGRPFLWGLTLLDTVTILGAGIPFLHSFYNFINTQEIDELVKKCYNV